MNEHHRDLEYFNVIVKIPIQWGDMDAYNHVNNTIFFRFFESARIAYLDKIHFVESRNQGGVGAILHSTECRFRRPLRFPDEVLVGARVTSMHTDRFKHEYRIYSTTQNAIAADGWGLVVSYDYDKGEKAPIPHNVLQAIEAIDAVTVTPR